MIDNRYGFKDKGEDAHKRMSQGPCRTYGTDGTCFVQFNRKLKSYLSRPAGSKQQSPAPVCGRDGEVLLPRSIVQFEAQVAAVFTVAQ